MPHLSMGPAHTFVVSEVSAMRYVKYYGLRLESEAPIGDWPVKTTANKVLRKRTTLEEGL